MWQQVFPTGPERKEKMQFSATPSSMCKDLKVYRFRDIYVSVMYYVYVPFGPSLLRESTDSMMRRLGTKL